MAGASDPKRPCVLTFEVISADDFEDLRELYSLITGGDAMEAKASHWDKELQRCEGVPGAPPAVRLVGTPSTPVNLAHLAAVLKAFGVRVELVPADPVLR